jgi:hypothetical protein
VDDADGKPLAIEVLSRGAREQVFLALRLALIDQYGRRGARLPVVLDDVLVNFDGRRARAAARLLAEFAAGGHQLAVFTCHEHIAELFASQHAAVVELPENSSPGQSITVVAKPKATRRKPASSAAENGKQSAPAKAAQADIVERSEGEEDEVAPWDEENVAALSARRARRKPSSSARSKPSSRKRGARRAESLEPEPPDEALEDEAADDQDFDEDLLGEEEPEDEDLFDEGDEEDTEVEDDDPGEEEDEEPGDEEEDLDDDEDSDEDDSDEDWE